MIRSLSHSELRENPEVLASLEKLHFPTFQYHLLSVDYYHEYTQGAYRIEHLLVFDEGSVVGLCTTTEKDGGCSYFGAPLKPIFAKNIPEEKKRECFYLWIQTFEERIQAGRIRNLKFRDEPYFNSAFLKNLSVENEFEFFVNLHLTEELIMRGVRKSYRSLINWGRRELKTIQVNQGQTSAERFEEFRRFHIETSGRETRSKKTWDWQFLMIQRGQAYLNLCYWQDKLVSGVLNLCGMEEVYYGVGVNDRQLMSENKAIGHWCLSKSILDAKAYGYSIYNLGHAGPVFATEKEAQIGKFKSGFSDQMRVVNSGLARFHE